MRPILNFLCSFFISMQTFALVDMSSAAYSNTWIDLELAGDAYDLRVLRAYKSRTLFNGIFGFGWCSEFETDLKVLSEKSVKINECGDGLEIEYEAKTGESAKMLARGNEVEYVIREKTHFTRVLADGSSQRFDLNGKLTHSYNKTGQFIKLNYAEGRLVEVVDEDNRKLNFKYGPRGKVSKITGPNSLSTEYKHDDNDNLIWNKNAWAKTEKDVYTYEYNIFHNLTRATWPDNTDIKIQYDNKKDWVTSFVDRDSCTETYNYGTAKKSPELHHWAGVTKTCDGTITSKNHFEFWRKKNKSGKIVLQKAYSKQNNTVREVIYDINLEKPIKIIADNITSTYSYYPDGLVKSKKMPDFIEEYVYDPQIRKLSEYKVSEIKRGGKLKMVELTKFRYDNKGNVIFLENMTGDKISITYDFKGRIKTISDTAKNELVELEYEDKYGKPSIVKKQGVGSIQISYDKFGAIQKVDSQQKPETATKIAGAFNKLLGLISPVSKPVYE